MAVVRLVTDEIECCVRGSEVRRSRLVFEALGARQRQGGNVSLAHAHGRRGPQRAVMPGLSETERERERQREREREREREKEKESQSL